MLKDTKSLGNNKAPACESRGFVHKKRRCAFWHTFNPLLTNMDYIFYRLYRMYEKHGDPPYLSAVIHLCYSLGISLIIAFFAIKEWYDMQHKYAWFLEGLYSLCFLLVPLCLLIIYCCVRYRKKKILELKKKYQGCTRNKLISNWMIFCIPIYIAIIGILIFRKLFIAW